MKLTNIPQPTSEHQNMLVMVSWFSQETNLVIKAESFESKQSPENAQVKSMIETCGLVNKVFTLDALHCSKDTTKAIILIFKVLFR